MSTESLLFQPAVSTPIMGQDSQNWYALHTRSRHERLVAQRLTEQGVEAFLPITTEEHRWSDRKKTVQLPLFSCYVFARFVAKSSDRLQVLRIGGVLGLVGSQGVGTPIPDEQVDAVRILVEGAAPWDPYPFLKIGQRVRIRGGALEGMEGILVSRNGNQTLVITVDAIQRALAVRVEGYQVEAV
jgi:transcription antitermination factor NusG